MELRNRNRKFLLADFQLLEEIRKVLEARPSYGYKWVTILLNRALKERFDGSVNHKRVYRMMKENSLLLAPYGKKPIRVHEGKVITLNRNMR